MGRLQEAPQSQCFLILIQSPVGEKKFVSANGLSFNHPAQNIFFGGGITNTALLRLGAELKILNKICAWQLDAIFYTVFVNKRWATEATISGGARTVMDSSTATQRYIPSIFLQFLPKFLLDGLSTPT